MTPLSENQNQDSLDRLSDDMLYLPRFAGSLFKSITLLDLHRRFSLLLGV